LLSKQIFFIDCKGMKKAALKRRLIKEEINRVAYATTMTQ